MFPFLKLYNLILTVLKWATFPRTVPRPARRVAATVVRRVTWQRSAPSLATWPTFSVATVMRWVTTPRHVPSPVTVSTDDQKCILYKLANLSQCRASSA